VRTAWASASTFRGTDKRGGANGARIRFAPQKDWACEQARRAVEGADRAREHPGRVQPRRGGKKISLADLIVLGGCAAVEQAAKNAGVRTSKCRSRRAARTPRQEQTDVESFAVLEPGADGFRNYLGLRGEQRAEALLVDKAQLLTLTAPEMTVLVGGLRVLKANRMARHRRFHRSGRRH
jgi:catalase-peroxidase